MRAGGSAALNRGIRAWSSCRGYNRGIRQRVTFSSFVFVQVIKRLNRIWRVVRAGSPSRLFTVSSWCDDKNSTVLERRPWEDSAVHTRSEIPAVNYAETLGNQIHIKFQWKLWRTFGILTKFKENKCILQTKYIENNIWAIWAKAPSKSQVPSKYWAPCKPLGRTGQHPPNLQNSKKTKQ